MYMFCRQQLLAPPTSLMELLQRQWEQTAQFVMDQSSRQSNGRADITTMTHALCNNHLYHTAGAMLSRLYQLQTENQQMQERITNLAAQREFLLATNSQLGSIISESQQHQQHTANGLSEPSYNMPVEATDNMTTNLSIPPLSSTTVASITTHTTSTASVTTTGDIQTGHSNSVLVQASTYSSIDSPSMFALPPTSVTNTVVTSTSNEVIKPTSFRSKEVLPGEKKKQRNVKHPKQSTKLQQHLKANPAAMPGSVNVLGPPLFTTMKPSEGMLPHNSSVLIGSFIPAEPATATSDFINNPQVTIPLSRAGSFLPPFSEIAMELNGKAVTLSRDITAVTSAIGGPIPSMPPVVSGHNVVR